MILFKFRDSKFKIRKGPTLLCFVVAIGVNVASIMASYPFYLPGSTHTYIQAGLYASLNRVFVGASLGSMILLASFGTPGFLMDIFEWKPFRVLGKLVYNVYLVHTIGQFYNKGSLRTPLQTGVFPCLWPLFGDITFSFALSFLLFVLLENPVRVLVKILFQKDSPAPSGKQHATSHPA
ncbi:uncharacterized protein LOC134540348 [Bacillus rossius redtenbacheri]|uniref:uncharacterized protein LOC134540348 n=1 Tax=Bacillus rossius redtenbacheri TaxID=93214 RepID=UPI002FDEF803